MAPLTQKRRYRRNPIDVALRDYIQKSTMSQRNLCRNADIPESSLSSFMQGRRGLPLESVVRVCQVLDLVLVKRK